ATYVGGKIAGVLRGDPPRITGDGKNNIERLIEEKNKNKPEGVKDVIVDKKTIEFLDRQNFHLQTILPQGKMIDLSEKIGVSYGGNAVEMIEKISPDILEVLKKAGDVLNTPLVGFDFIIPDPTKKASDQKWGIIEANSLPFINLHHFPLEGTPQNVAGKIWDLWEI
ncbi:MAG: cyanophycin synthetase, partial [Patescibacteria group bacterium]|nr:cyanophycin synthetase [Patescibacteria group bacterium]